MQRTRSLLPVTGRFLGLLLVCATLVVAPGPSLHASTTPTGALFPNTTTNTTSAAMQVGPSGGMHGAYSTDPEFQATYTFCPPTADCAQATNWAQATFQTNVHEVQLALTPQGNPRMLLTIDNYSQPAPNGLNDTYWYAQCDSSCTTSSSWVTTFITGTLDIASSLNPAGKHFFALDPQGRPRFVFGPSYGFDPITFQQTSWMNYVTCDTACTATGAIDPVTGMPIPVNWSFSKINATFVQPALTFTAAGQPRVAGFSATNDVHGNDIIAYASCDTACTTSAPWSTTTVGQPGVGDGTVALHMTSHDQPRLISYFTTTRATYLWCNSSCTTGANWGSVPIGPGLNDGGDPDLQLDHQDRPRVAFHAEALPPAGVGVGLGYAWCDTNCESSTASFRNILADDSSQLNSDWPLPRPANCTGAAWLAGYTPVVALDASGNPRLAADSVFVASGCPPPDVTVDLHSGVRFVYFNQPSTPGGSPRVFVPLIRR